MESGERKIKNDGGFGEEYKFEKKCNGELNIRRRERVRKSQRQNLIHHER